MKLCCTPPCCTPPSLDFIYPIFSLYKYFNYIANAIVSFKICILLLSSESCLEIRKVYTAKCTGI